MLLPILYLLLLPSSTLALTPLSTVFAVSTDTKTSSGCQKYFEPNPKKPGKALNVAWEQIHEINTAALKALTEEEYEGDEEVRRLVTRFFGIKPQKTAAGKEEIPTNGDDLGRLQRVKHYYTNLASLLNGHPQHPATMSYEKFHLSCSGTFTDLQTETDMLESRSGQLLRQTQSQGKGVTLESWLRATGKTESDNWWVKSSDPETSYFPLSKSLYPPQEGSQLPWPLDEKGNAQLCNAGHDAYTTEGVEFLLQSSGSGVYTGEKRIYRPRIVLCPRVFKGYKFRGPLTKMIPDGKQKEGTMLDSLATGGLTLYHELFHLQAVLEGKAAVRGFPDSLARRARCERDGEDKCKKGLGKKWWTKKSGFTTDIPNFYAAKSAAGEGSSSSKNAEKTYYDFNVAGAMAATYLTLYDLADPPSTDLSYPKPDPSQKGNGQASLYSPENYVWFAYAVYLHQKNPTDHWSSGFCRKKAQTLEESLSPVEGEWYFRVP